MGVQHHLGNQLSVWLCHCKAGGRGSGGGGRGNKRRKGEGRKGEGRGIGKGGDQGKGKILISANTEMELEKGEGKQINRTHLRKSCLRLSGRFDLPAYPGFMVTKMAMSGFTFTVFPTSSTVIGFDPGVSRKGEEGEEDRGKERGEGMTEGGEQGGVGVHVKMEGKGR